MTICGSCGLRRIATSGSPSSLHPGAEKPCGRQIGVEHQRKICEAAPSSRLLTASMTLANSATTLSSAVLAIRPPG